MSGNRGQGIPNPKRKTIRLGRQTPDPRAPERTSESIADDLRRFRRSGGRIEKVPGFSGEVAPRRPKR